MAKKQKKQKKGFQLSRTARRLGISERENIRFQQDIRRANLRLSRLREEGLEPRIATNIMSVVGNTFPTVSRIATHDEYENTRNLLNRFLSAKTSTVRGARTESTKRYENFKKLLQRTTGQKISDESYRVIYQSLGDLDWNVLTENYAYDEIRKMQYDLYTRGVPPTNSYVTTALDDGIHVAIGDYLSKYISRDFILDTGVGFHDFDYYIELALSRDVRSAINEYQSDKNFAEIDDYDFLE